MSGREWKPGDMAIVKPPGRSETVAMYLDGGGWETPCAEHDGRTTYEAFPDYSHGLVGRPLVVIDPEDRETIDRWRERVGGDFRFLTSADLLRAALREFANPPSPRPEEPTGLGAVVEDADGKPWVRHADRKYPWTTGGDDGYESRRYADIAAVRVLSEGVQAGDPR